jgi:hypothetical protein
MADKTKKFSRFRRFKDIKNMHYIWHPQGNHTTGDYRIFIDRYTRKRKKDKQEDNQKKDEDNIEDKGFQ